MWGIFLLSKQIGAHASCQAVKEKYKCTVWNAKFTYAATQERSASMVSTQHEVAHKDCAKDKKGKLGYLILNLT